MVCLEQCLARGDLSYDCVPFLADTARTRVRNIPFPEHGNITILQLPAVRFQRMEGGWISPEVASIVRTEGSEEDLICLLESDSHKLWIDL